MAIDRIGRRQTLRAALAASVVAGVGAGGIGSARAAGREAAEPGGYGGQLPPVPGMLGDRLANEFWYVFDDVTLFHRSPELDDAYTAIRTYAGGLEAPVIAAWSSRYGRPGYPGTFRDWMAPVAEQLRLISKVQLGVVDRFYRRHDPRLVTAFAGFGQGTLYDPRRPDEALTVHTMNGEAGYHAWHVYARAMALLGIDRWRWEEIGPLVGFAWALQSIAKPSTRSPNAPLPPRTVARQAAYWLPRSMERQDADFLSYPYPRGVS
ncbi:hypothetical protein A8W25_13160 [Streptomyces sp. ERV7]|uniref:hypothetical protein n=1 Tax=Streptomyces sp. ERV7 TaxID=1322334 RepID=UPI0007F35A84|nr:hypothetical protein [Streptomyces sp. ERV7]OAR26365.1 hypothetical protein A8W25_13160 [Streptomyces sp. ERV7]